MRCRREKGGNRKRRPESRKGCYQSKFPASIDRTRKQGYRETGPPKPWQRWPPKELVATFETAPRFGESSVQRESAAPKIAGLEVGKLTTLKARARQTRDCKHKMPPGDPRTRNRKTP